MNENISTDTIVLVIQHIGTEVNHNKLLSALRNAIRPFVDTSIIAEHLEECPVDLLDLAVMGESVRFQIVDYLLEGGLVE